MLLKTNFSRSDMAPKLTDFFFNFQGKMADRGEFCLYHEHRKSKDTK